MDTPGLTIPILLELTPIFFSCSAVWLLFAITLSNLRIAGIHNSLYRGWLTATSSPCVYAIARAPVMRAATNAIGAVSPLPANIKVGFNFLAN